MAKLNVIVPRDSVRPISVLISGEIEGLPLSQAIKSTTAVILLKFGRLSSVDVHLADGSKSTHVWGEWDLIVEFGNWAVEKAGSQRCDAESTDSAIEAVLQTLEGQNVTRFSILDSGQLKVALEDGDVFTISASGLSGSLSQWMLFRQKRWSLALENSGQLVLEVEKELVEW